VLLELELLLLLLLPESLPLSLLEELLLLLLSLLLLFLLFFFLLLFFLPFLRFFLLPSPLQLAVEAARGAALQESLRPPTSPADGLLQLPLLQAASTTK